MVTMKSSAFFRTWRLQFACRVHCLFWWRLSYTWQRGDSTLPLMLHHKSDMAITSQLACCHEWTGLWMNRHLSGRDKGNIADTCSVIRRDVFESCLSYVSRGNWFLHWLTDRNLWEQGNPNHHTSFFLGKRVVWQIPPLLWVMLIKARIGHSAPSKSFRNREELLRATTLRRA